LRHGKILLLTEYQLIKISENTMHFLDEKH